MDGIAGPLPRRKGRFVFDDGEKRYYIPIEMDGQELVDLVHASEKRSGMLTVIQITPTGKVLKVV